MIGLDLGNSGFVGTTGLAATVFEDFGSFTPGDFMSVHTGKMVLKFGDFIYESGGYITSIAGGLISIAALKPSGFVTSAHHQVEVVQGPRTGSVSGNAQGAACCIQADGRNYHCYSDDSTAYFGYGDGAGSGDSYLGYSHGFLASGLKFRMKASGSGVLRVVTAEVDTGAGYFTPSGWANRDFGVGRRLDGGDAGVSGYNSLATARLTSVAVNNL